ncbi:hypothetical protein DAPPUDRAFT_316151 [Daphnia pulex]|uniref:Uncharacterized protein n=1 Tax=Daphnia pulex TaxID=6669 RepID=E9GBW0_DAPPU|nr:hypothetical protein DAPPUDRAFT_316151 [Daphnia pulex]|eukprot:EFX83027.1 hypothetical protein DAPPUDRAFT_316151 [Daphnia pulex]
MIRIQQVLDEFPRISVFWTTVPFDRATKAFYEAKSNVMGPPMLRLLLIPYYVYEGHVEG